MRDVDVNKYFDCEYFADEELLEWWGKNFRNSGCFSEKHQKFVNSTQNIYGDGCSASQNMMAWSVWRESNLECQSRYLAINQNTRRRHGQGKRFMVDWFYRSLFLNQKEIKNKNQNRRFSLKRVAYWHVFSTNSLNPYKTKWWELMDWLLCNITQNVHLPSLTLFFNSKNVMLRKFSIKHYFILNLIAMVGAGDHKVR